MSADMGDDSLSAVDAVHPPESLAELPTVIADARAVLGAVVDFNRKHVAWMSGYYDRNDAWAEGVAASVDELTGMREVDDFLVLAGHLIECTVVGQGGATGGRALGLLERHAALVEGVRSLTPHMAEGLPTAGEASR